MSAGENAVPEGEETHPMLLSAYEVARLEKIKKNDEFLAQLGEHTFNYCDL